MIGVDDVEGVAAEIGAGGGKFFPGQLSVVIGVHLAEAFRRIGNAGGRAVSGAGHGEGGGDGAGKSKQKGGGPGRDNIHRIPLQIVGGKGRNRRSCRARARKRRS